MTPEVQAAFLRVMAKRHDLEAAKLRMRAAAVLAGAAFQRFAEAYQTANDRELAEHPDMAELNVRLDALYEPPAWRP